MDIKDIAGLLLSSDSLTGISKNTGTSSGDVKNVLAAALPALLSGAEGQAKDEKSGFAKALSDHAESDTDDLSGFLGGVDLDDGAKIISHLLGKKNKSTTKKVAKKTGVSEGEVSGILSSAAPLLMSLLGKKTKSDGIDALLGGLDLGDILMNVLTDGDDGKKMKNKKSKKKADDSTPLGSLVGGLLKNLLK